MSQILVDKEALTKLIRTLNGPPVFIRELLVLRGATFPGNPIDVLQAALEQSNNEKSPDSNV